MSDLASLKRALLKIKGQARELRTEKLGKRLNPAKPKPKEEPLLAEGSDEEEAAEPEKEAKAEGDDKKKPSAAMEEIRKLLARS